MREIWQLYEIIINEVKATFLQQALNSIWTFIM